MATEENDGVETVDGQVILINTLKYKKLIFGTFFIGLFSKISLATIGSRY